MSGWRAFLVRLGAGLAVAGFCLLLLEGGLRLLPLDRWEAPGAQRSHPLFIAGVGEQVGNYVTNPHFATIMSPQRFPQVKSPEVKRVFVVGGSAALGWPGPAAAAFSGYLQRALERVAPGRYQIVNAAAMSYGSHRVLDLLGDIVQFAPDLVVIWSGNNEYIERNALPPLARNRTMGGLQRLLRHSALYRAVRLTLEAVTPGLFTRGEGVDITDPRSNPLVRRGMLGRSAETDREVLANYRANLQAMARLAAANRVPVLFCTVPVNLAGWVPGNLSDWATVPPPVPIDDPTVARNWELFRDEASRSGEQGRYHEAAVALEQLLRITPDYPLGHYLLGVSYRQLGRDREAHQAFSAARDLDPRPVRALTAFDQALREVAVGAGATLVDLDRVFAAASPAGVPGLELFLDYVHPNAAGHKLAATALLKPLAEALDPALPVKELAGLVTDDDWLVRHPQNQANMNYTLGMTLFNNGDLDGAERAYRQALAERPDFSEPAGNLGVIYETRGDLPKAREFYRQALRFDSGSHHAGNLARVYYLLGDRKAARELGEKLLAQGVIDVRLFIMLGDIAAAERRYRSAGEFYRRAQAAGADDPDLPARLAAVDAGLRGAP